MCSNEYRMGMPGNYAVPAPGSHPLREIPHHKNDQSGCAPKLIVSFVVLINRGKKSLRIGNMDHYRDAKFTAFRPDGIDSRIIDGNNFPAFVFCSQTQVFCDLQSPCSGSDCLFKPFSLFNTKFRLIDPAEIRAEKDQESVF
jgi:hypothetical protein